MAVGVWFQIWGAAGYKATSKVGFSHWNMQERLARQVLPLPGGIVVMHVC